MKQIESTACKTETDMQYRVTPKWKRAFDLLVLALLLPGLLLLFTLISILIKLVSRGPIFFVQERIGFRGQKFKCFKFRSMRLHADTEIHTSHITRVMQSNQPMRKLDAAGDPRLIPLGRQLRASGLDELPQLINVLKGDMSIVGPRPCTAYEYALYEDRHKARFTVLPGLTGLWQVSGKNQTTFEEMIGLDVKYAQTASPWLDLKIIALTLPTLMNQVRENLPLPTGTETRHPKRALAGSALKVT